MSNQEELLAYLLLKESEEESILLSECMQKEKSKVNSMLENRNEEGCYSILVNRHLLKDEKKFREFFRVNISQFGYLLDLIKDEITKNSSNRYPYPITPDEKLAITLRFMATGESFHSLAFSFRISVSYISRCVKMTLYALSNKLAPIFLLPPTCDDLRSKSEEFYQKWQYPNYVGGIDGKHIRIWFPARTGSLYLNYKNYFSIVLLAVVDANYKFIFTDAGSYGKEGDSGIFEKSNLGKQFRNGNIFPPPQKLPNCDVVLPHVFVGDEAFRLHTNMMKPYPRSVASADNQKAIFNYRLSRARRVSKNAFALLSQVFRIFYTPIALKPDTADRLVVVACCLHNMLRDAFLENGKTAYYEFDPTESMPKNNLIPLARSGGFANIDGFSVRDSYMKYFNSRAGTITWQNHQVSRTN